MSESTSQSPIASASSGEEGDGIGSAVFDRWSHAYGWFYDRSDAADEETRKAENLKAREEAYLALINKTSPWPDWFVPSVSLLKPGTLFQMAMAKEQPDDRLGAFGTFDDIHTVAEVRDELAVLQSWKPTLDRVNRYRITRIMPVHVGPVGPQIDPATNRILHGRFSQFQMLVDAHDRAKYVELVSTHPIDQG